MAEEGQKPGVQIVQTGYIVLLSVLVYSQLHSPTLRQEKCCRGLVIMLLSRRFQFVPDFPALAILQR